MITFLYYMLVMFGPVIFIGLLLDKRDHERAEDEKIRKFLEDINRMSHWSD